jgi:hypothetical protein
MEGHADVGTPGERWPLHSVGRNTENARSAMPSRSVDDVSPLECNAHRARCLPQMSAKSSCARMHMARTGPVSPRPRPDRLSLRYLCKIATAKSMRASMHVSSKETAASAQRAGRVPIGTPERPDRDHPACRVVTRQSCQTGAALTFAKASTAKSIRARMLVSSKEAAASARWAGRVPIGTPQRPDRDDLACGIGMTRRSCPTGAGSHLCKNLFRKFAKIVDDPEEPVAPGTSGVPESRSGLCNLPIGTLSARRLRRAPVALAKTASVNSPESDPGPLLQRLYRKVPGPRERGRGFTPANLLPQTFPESDRVGGRDGDGDPAHRPERDPAGVPSRRMNP